MSKITVTVDAEGRDKFTFDWEGGVQDMENIINNIESIARDGGVGPVQLVKSALAHFPSTGPLPEPEGTIQRRAILFAVLDFVNARADDLPEPALDCLAKHNSIAIATIRGGKAWIEVGGLPWARGEHRH
jgi:hypothetical protein